jgi:tetraacyldisaccharide 4'-kinase
MRAPGFYYRRPGLAAFILLPFAMIYGAVAAWLMGRPGARAAVPVICIGNPTLGGAGKTPTAIAIAKLLAAMGERPAFLSRGYRGSNAGPVLVDPAKHDARAVGDEPLLLAGAFPTVVARNRAAGAALASAQGASVIVMDDGFQSPSLSKDLSLLVIDAATGIGNGDVFPAGPLRAPLHAQLAFAHGVVRVGRGEASSFVEEQAKAEGLEVFAAELTPDPQVAAQMKGRKLLAFAGIGHPQKFFATLRSLGAVVSEARGFADHHRYGAAEARELLEIAKAGGLMLVSTEKDLARMKGDAALNELAAQSTALPVRLQFEDEESVRELLRRALKQRRG